MPEYRILCSACRKKLRLPEAVLGRRVRCPRCGFAFLAEVAGVRPRATVVEHRPVAPPPDETADELVGRSLGRYKLVRRIGRGGRGVVYEAEDTLLGRPAAVKVLLPEVMSARPDAVQRFILEARAASKLEHPNCVGIYSIEKQDGLVFIAMPLIRGRSALDLLKDRGPLDPLEATRICRLAATGLAAAHAMGLVHRDVKPDNILVAAGGEVKVADFGMVKMTDDAVAAITEPGKWLGTPFYMSPEQCRGEKVDGRSDVYSLGATYYCLLGGRPPFWGLPAMKVIYKQITEDPESVQKLNPQVPLICARVVERAMAKLPQDRYQSADKLAAALDNVEQSLRQAVTGRRQKLSDEPSSTELEVMVDKPAALDSTEAQARDREPAPPQTAPADGDESTGYGTGLQEEEDTTTFRAQAAGLDPALNVSALVRVGFASAAEAKGAWRYVRRRIRERFTPEFGTGPDRCGYLKVVLDAPVAEVKRMVQTLLYTDGRLLDLQTSDPVADVWLRDNLGSAPVQ